MATTFLTLVNDTLKRLNEVQITSDDFPTAIGFHASVKDAVNIALEEIGQEQFGFPFKPPDRFVNPGCWHINLLRPE
jgi:hypothetical protein